VIRVAQLGIAMALLGIVITFMGLFPGLIGFPPTPGVGVTQILLMIGGLSLLILGALTFVRFMFYANQPLTLAQQIGIRLALTGLTFAALGALADVLGFGSNLRRLGEDILFGPIQMVGLLISFGAASAGVMLFALAGQPEVTRDE
jgi:hypothetical protein